MCTTNYSNYNIKIMICIHLIKMLRCHIMTRKKKFVLMIFMGMREKRNSIWYSFLYFFLFFLCDTSHVKIIKPWALSRLNFLSCSTRRLLKWNVSLLVENKRNFSSCFSYRLSLKTISCETLKFYYNVFITTVNF